MFSLELKSKSKYLFCIFVLLIVTFLLYCASFETTQGEEIELENIVDYTEVEVGEVLILEMQLQDILKDDVFLYLSENQELAVYVDDILVEELKMKESLAFLKTVGDIWVEVPLTEEMNGKTLRIEIQSDFIYYQEIHSNFYIVNKQVVTSLKYEKSWLLASIAIILLLLGVGSLFEGMLWKEGASRKILFAMSELYIATSIWLLAEINAFNYFFEKPILSYLVAMIFIRVVPITLFKLLELSLPFETKVARAFKVLLWVNLVGSCFLQIVCQVSFISLLWLNNAFILLGSILWVVALYHSYQLVKKQHVTGETFLYSIILILGCFVDIYFYYFIPEFRPLVCLPTGIAFLLYYIVVHMSLVRRNVTLEIEKKELETNYHKLKNTNLVLQIKAHFFFNTLHSISMLCKTNPLKADGAINLFVRYMRNYMHLINSQMPIRFEEELEVVKAYVEIENIRFDNSILVEYELEYIDFSVPPLCIQPLIENAIIHGVRHVQCEGKILLKTVKREKCVDIIIIDNGIGFDIENLEEKKALAITNIKQRIHSMVDGTVIFESTEYVGTKITLTIPLNT